VRNLVALARLTNDPRYLDAAGKALDAFSPQLSQSPAALPLMLVGLEEYLDARPGAATAPGADPLADTGPLPGGVKGLVSVKVESITPRTVADHNEFDLTLSLTVREGWHVYANPPGVEGLPPTRLTIDPGQGFLIDRVDYPKGVAKVLAASGTEKVALYEGMVKLTAHVKPERDAKGTAPDVLRFTVSFQACNDRACLAPAKAAVVARLREGR
jgi:DsbC/DsbD-like thiol-disulfide interchange protein